MALTWKQLKEQIEKSGVKDDMEIEFIDVHMPWDADDVTASVDDSDNTFSVSN